MNENRIAFSLTTSATRKIGMADALMPHLTEFSFFC